MKKILDKKELKNYEIKIVGGSIFINEDLQKEIDSEWEVFVDECKKRNADVWNGEKYRYEGVELLADKTLLFFSLTDYKTSTMLLRLARETDRNNLIVSSVVVTSDNFLVFPRRGKVGTNTGLLSLVAGGFEPIESSSNLIEDNMHVELEEELGLSREEYTLNTPVFYDFEEQGLYGFMFNTNVILSKNDLKKRFLETNHDDENTELVFFENTKRGIGDIMKREDVFHLTQKYFKKEYEIKH